MDKKDEQNSIDRGLKELLRRAKKNKASKETHQSVDGNEELEQNITEEEKSKNTFHRLTGWEDESVDVSLRTIIGGDILAGRWFRRHIKFLFVLVLLAILYVSNRYHYQQVMIDNRKLTLKLEDRRLRAVVATSNLTEYLRRSNISTQLTDTTLKSSPEPFYYLQTN